MLALLVLHLLAAPTPGCVVPFDAVEIGQALETQHVGAGYRAFDTGVGDSTAIMSADKRVSVMTFGCRGDYQDEIAQEDAEVAAGRYRIVRTVNDTAMAIGVFWKPPTVREAVVLRATLAALTP